MTLCFPPCAQNEETVLMVASSKGDLGVVQALLAAGADKEARSKVGSERGAGVP